LVLAHGLDNKKQKLDSKEISPATKLDCIATIPQVIVRTHGGTSSCIFSITSPNPVVFSVRHNPYHLPYFTTEMSTILWDTDVQYTPVPYIGIKSRIMLVLHQY
jgi:hypothetical protein